MVLARINVHGRKRGEADESDFFVAGEEEDEQSVDDEQKVDE